MNYFTEFKEFLHYFNNPHENQNYIHIAGTKGKTSTSYYCYELLQQLGYKTALFISPHVYSSYERIQYNGMLIDEKEYEYYSNQVKKAKIDLNYSLQYFTEWLLIAFLYFKDKKPDFIVLEVGIGGLLDTTNVVDPMISLITRIGKDHTAILGNSLKQIAKHKLGIIKKGKPFIIGKQNFWINIISFFQKYFNKKQKKTFLPYRAYFQKENIKLEIDNRNISLIGPAYMVENFVLAFSALKALKIDTHSISSFIHKVPGRFELITDGNQTLLLDGAHNPIAIKMLLKTIKSRYKNKKWAIILCIKYDKPVKKMILQLNKIAELFVISDFTEELGQDFSPKEIKRFLKSLEVFYICSSVKDLSLLLKETPYILVTGSFYHLHIIKALFQNKEITA